MNEIHEIHEIHEIPFKPTDKILELGGGSNPLFHPNYDIRQLPNVDKVIDLNYPLPLPSYSFDGVYSSYLLEHLSWRNVRHFLEEIHRILKVGSKILIKTSNLLEQSRVVVNSPSDKWNDNLIGLVFGGQDFNENSHQCGFSPEYIKKILKEIGFDNINITPIISDFGPTDMQIEAVKIYIEGLKTITGIRSQWILQHCELGKKILDIGSNDGHIFNDTPFIKYVTSIDLDVYSIPNFYQMDAADLQFPSKSFDIGNLAEILEHVEDPVQVLKEADRVCKKILITVPDEWNWAKELFPFETLEEAVKRKNKTIEQLAIEGNPTAKELYTKDDHKHLFHNRHYTEETLRQDLEKAGIKDYEMNRLQYDGWSFFCVIADTPITDADHIDDHAKGPIITTGKLIEDKNLEDKNLRIALISTPFFSVPPLKYGGLEQVIWDLACGLDECGHKVTIFAPEGSKSTEHCELVITGPSINTVGVDWFEEEKRRYNVYKDIITPEKFDIVHDHTWFGFIYLSKGKYTNLRMIHTHHGGYNWESPPPVPKPNLVAISNYMKIYTEQYFKQIGYNIQSEYVLNGINIDKYHFDPNIKKTDRLLFVGRLSTFKQPHVAVEVARKTGHCLDIIGSASFIDSVDYVMQLDKLVENDPNIKIYKDADHDFKIKKMQEAKCLIFPSKMGEPLGLVAQEAMACGTPVIATRDGAIPEIVVDGETGFICDTEKQMIEAINKVNTIKPDTCRKHIEENFSRLRMAKEYEKLFYRMIKGENW